MRPESIEFQAFGPYAGHESVDLTDVSEKGLFLICGKTGCGKTMILDAMTFALFGKSSGNGRDDFASMRCTRADENTPTFVKFIFENNGRHYLFERRLEKKRKNLSPSYNLMKKDDDGVWRVMLENAKEKALNDKAEEIIGLSYSQFRQVIVLPQGQFERFLTSTSDEKEKILTSIFGQEQWKKIAECFYEEAEERRNKLREIKDWITRSLLEESVSSADELELKIKGMKEEEESLTAGFKKAEYDKKIKHSRDILAAIRQLNALKEAYDQRIVNEDNAREAAKKAAEKADEAAAALKEHAGKEDKNEENKALIIRYEAKRSDYEGIDKAVKELGEAESAAKEAKKAEEAAKAKHDAFIPLIKQLNDEFEALRAEHSAMLKDFINGIAGELAADLKEGEPCPVCGSKEHPHKAERSEKYVTKDQVDEKKDESDEKYGQMQDAVSRQEKAKTDLNIKHEAAAEADRAVERALTRLEDLKKNLVHGIGTLKELNDKIAVLTKEIRDYENIKNELTQVEKDGREAHQKMKAAAEAAAKEKEDALKAYEKTLNETRDSLKGEEPDEDKCLETLDGYMQAKDEYNRRIAVLEAGRTRLNLKLNTIREEGRDIEEKILTAEEDHAFAKRLRGDSGTGLQRYVLGIMFSSVVAAANRMLEMIHGGRYRLYRSDDKAAGSNKRGLELKVFDKNSGEHEGRFVSTLSGGEKFLVSLALSIGMSTVAARGGISMEALFIDEGFGTLDDDSIDDAMSVLDSIRAANGMVGIISHVRILQERIPNKLRVVEDEGGSRIIRSVG